MSEDHCADIAEFLEIRSWNVMETSNKQNGKVMNWCKLKQLKNSFFSLDFGKQGTCQYFLVKSTVQLSRVVLVSPAYIDARHWKNLGGECVWFSIELIISRTSVLN